MISYCCANELNRRVRDVSKTRNGEQETRNGDMERVVSFNYKKSKWRIRRLL